MLKRISAVIMALLMLFAMTACSISDSDIDALTELAESAYAAQTASDASDSSETSDVNESPADTAEINSDASDSAATEVYDPNTAEYASAPDAATDEAIDDNQELLDENGTYDSKDEVALYIHQYGHLPDNYITKKEAQNLGWSGGSLEPYAPGKCIGGSYFGNYEGILPTADGREYHECDIDTLGASSRGAKRIVFSNDGLIYYTEDHYETFELLYGDGSQ